MNFQNLFDVTPRFASGEGATPTRLYSQLFGLVGEQVPRVIDFAP